MNTHPVNRIVSYTGQALGYTAFCAVVAYFSVAPPYRHLPPDGALVKLSLQHAGQRKEACHERTPEELAKLAPNMRAASVCPRERVPVAVEIELDGRMLVRESVPPSGFAKDGSATLYRRVGVPAGEHRVVARLGDAPAPGFGYVKETTVTLKPGAILLLDFDANAGGWVFRS
ncbi:hypothetical protein BURK1_03119 [Burkholderiales bacterium]|nr:hypothetical protein BURK1_03119 [Burkholderiales bacterium]